MKLVLFGDSLFGQAGKHRVEMLEAALGGQYDVYNCAVGGWDTADLVKKSDYLASLKPELMVLSVGTNDAASWRDVSVEQFQANLRTVLASWQSSRVIFFLPPPVNEAMQVAPKIRYNTDIKQYHDAAVVLCNELGVQYIHSWNVFKPMLDAGDNYHVEDGVHLNDEGYQIIWNEVAKVLA